MDATTETTADFCDRWLRAWTGNRPEALLAFYAADAYYRDPAVPDGLRGLAEIRAYVAPLLARNPTWTWTATEVLPTSSGFALKWHASIPVGDTSVEEDGLDIVEVVDGKITRNEVYFDRVRLLGAIRNATKRR